MKFWLTVYKVAWCILVLLLVAGVISVFLPSIRENREKHRKISALETENQQKEEHIRKMRENQERFRKDPEFVERIAREELGKAKEGETIFRYSKPEEDH